MSRPFILITNDDGIQAPGLKHLWEAVHEYMDVAIVAPLIEKSGSGVSITWGKPLRIQEIAWEAGTPAWSVNGTPADCIKMATTVLLDTPPQLIISGINRGSNAGRTVLYSGTIGAVIEGALKGIPGIAFSFSDETIPPLSVTKKYIHPLIKHFLTYPLPPETILNVNFPTSSFGPIKGVCMAKQGKGYWIEQPDRRMHPEGIPYYWLGGKWCPFLEEPDSDVALLEQGYVTAVPIQIGQLTHHGVLEQHKEAIQTTFNSPLSHPAQST